MIRNRLGGLAIGLAALTLLGAAVAFAVADQGSRVASDLANIQALEGAETDAALYRANLAIAVAATTDRDDQTVEKAVAAALAALDRIEQGGLPNVDLLADLDILRLAASDIGAALRADDSSGATAVAIQAASPALNRIAQALGASSAALRAAIEAEQQDAGRVARLSSFSAALIAPALVLWAYRNSARRRLDRQRLEGDLRRSLELSGAKDELIAGLSHQLRTPLTGIQGFSSTLLDQAKTGDLDPDLVTELMRAVYDESVDLGRMIDDFLVVSRNEAGSLAFVNEATQITEIVQPVADIVARTGREFVVQIEEAQVIADPFRLRHLLRNLVANAFSHGREPVVLRGSLSPTGYLLQVADHGEGMGTGEMARAVEGFIHTPRETTVTGSLGLGLKAATILAEGIGTKLEYRRTGSLTVFELRLAVSELANTRQVSYSATPG